jgi:hypothetical protein
MSPRWRQVVGSGMRAGSRARKVLRASIGAPRAKSHTPGTLDTFSGISAHLHTCLLCVCGGQCRHDNWQHHCESSAGGQGASDKSSTTLHHGSRPSSRRGVAAHSPAGPMVRLPVGSGGRNRCDCCVCARVKSQDSRADGRVLSRDSLSFPGARSHSPGGHVKRCSCWRRWAASLARALLCTLPWLVAGLRVLWRGCTPGLSVHDLASSWQPAVSRARPASQGRGEAPALA